MRRELKIDRELLSDLEAIQRDYLPTDDSGPRRIDAAFVTAFKKAGLDLDSSQPAESKKWISSRTDPVTIAAYLDDWAYLRRTGNAPESDWKRLISVAKEADSDPWRNAPRLLLDRGDRKTALCMAQDEDALAVQPAKSLLLLARVLEFTRDPNSDESHDPSIKILKRSWILDPSDSQVARALAEACEQQRYWEDSHQANASALSKARIDRIRYACAAIAANPKGARLHAELADALLPHSATGGGMFTAAIEPIPQPRDPHNPPGVTLPRWGFQISPSKKLLIGPVWPCDLSSIDLGDLNDAICEYREAARLAPTDWVAALRLGNLLILKGDTEAAVANYLEAAKCGPQGRLVHTEAADRLYLRGKLDLALPEIREAIRLDPSQGRDHILLGLIYHEQGKLSMAFTEYKEALWRPDSLGFLVVHALEATGKPEEVRQAYREALDKAIQAKSSSGMMFNQIAWGLATSRSPGSRDGLAAVASATKACELGEWKYPPFLDTLAAAYAESGNFDEAVKWQTEAIEIQKDEKEKNDYRSRLKLYQDKKPYHQPEP